MNKRMRIDNAADEEPGSSNKTVSEESWQLGYKNSYSNVEELPQNIQFKKEEKNILKQVAKMYHMRVTNHYFSLIQDPNNLNDPIRKQCIPAVEELSQEGYESIDPLAEEKTSPTSCLVHRYPDRALLLVTNRCFMYCRHCTRKRLWQNKREESSLEDIEKAVKYIKNNKQIREIIVSGGDPFTLATERLDYILSSLNNLDNIKVIRIGTRAPVVLPQRIDESLCSMLSKYDNLWINLQFNHPREVNKQSILACQKLTACGIPLSNQSVLLKGINDDSKVMTKLCHQLQEIRVRPYYIYQCDPVVGAWHFRTSLWKGVDLIEKMRGYTSGMCIPTFVVDGIEGKGKVPLSPNYLISSDREGVVFKNYKDEIFFYQNKDNNMNKQESKADKVNNIGIVFNLKKGNIEGQEEYDEIETIEAIKEELETLKFKVSLFEQDDNFLENIAKNKPDFVLNIAEGKGSGRGRESQVPSILESLSIPYSGSDAISLGNALDKYTTNFMLTFKGIAVPKMYMVSDKGELDSLKEIFKDKLNYIVKPRWEGSSKGIFINSLVNNFKDLKDRVLMILSDYKQPAIIEEFLEKDEITVGVCGNKDKVKVLGMMKIVPVSDSNKPFIYSIENKRDWKTKVKYESEKSIPEEVKKQIAAMAIEAFNLFELRDIARIDFRLDSQSTPRIIDINPLPGLSANYSDLPILYRLKGYSYSQLIKNILEEAFTRYGFSFKI